MKEYALEELFNLQMGKTPARDKAVYWNTGEHKWISISDLSKCGKYITETKESISESAVRECGIGQIPPNTVVMSFKLSIGKTAITKEPMYSNEAIMAFNDKHIVDLLPDYVYYLLSGRDWDKGTNKAVMGKTLNKATLSKIKVRVHGLRQQQEIVAVLDKISAIREDQREQLSALDDLVKARFVEMFGDPADNPKGWPTKPLLEMGSCKNGMNFRPGESGVKMLCLGVGDFQDHAVITDVAALPLISLNERPAEEYLLQNGDIVFVRSNGNKALVGRSVAIYPDAASVTFSGFCIRYRKHDDRVEVPYLLQVLKSDSIRIKMTGRGANIQNLNQQILGSLVIPVPPKDSQKRFAAFVAQVDKSKSVVQKSLEETQLLFDSLMQKYFG